MIPSYRAIAFRDYPTAFLDIDTRSYIQNTTLVRAMLDTNPTKIGGDLTVGQGVIVYDCTIEDRWLIEMGAILLNGCPVGSDSIVVVDTGVPEGRPIPPGLMEMGVPEKVQRSLTWEEGALITQYAERDVRYRFDCQTEQSV